MALSLRFGPRSLRHALPTDPIPSRATSRQAQSPRGARQAKPQQKPQRQSGGIGGSTTEGLQRFRA
eukprot:15475577-Alexandrium_andersonii.AAC.1